MSYNDVKLENNELENEINIPQPVLNDENETQQKSHVDFSQTIENLDAHLKLDYLQYAYLSQYLHIQQTSLKDDKDGILQFFTDTYHKEELLLSFPEWLHLKIRDINQNYIRETNKKLTYLDQQFSQLDNTINSLNLENKNDLRILKDIIRTLDN